jgi:hypothetical protein
VLGFEGHHVVDMNERLRDIWRNSRPIYVIVHDPDDDELYYGNLARMADVLPLAQDLANSYDPTRDTEYVSSRLGRHLSRLHHPVSDLGEDELRLHKTWVPLYQDWRLTPDGPDRFLDTATKEAVQPIPDYDYVGGEVQVYVTYPDETIGPSREDLKRTEDSGCVSQPSKAARADVTRTPASSRLRTPQVIQFGLTGTTRDHESRTSCGAYRSREDIEHSNLGGLGASCGYRSVEEGSVAEPLLQAVHGGRFVREFGDRQARPGESLALARCDKRDVAGAARGENQADVPGYAGRRCRLRGGCWSGNGGDNAREQGSSHNAQVPPSAAQAPGRA